MRSATENETITCALCRMFVFARVCSDRVCVCLCVFLRTSSDASRDPSRALELLIGAAQCIEMRTDLLGTEQVVACRLLEEPAHLLFMLVSGPRESRPFQSERAAPDQNVRGRWMHRGKGVENRDPHRWLVLRGEVFMVRTDSVYAGMRLGGYSSGAALP
eukprot:919039-Rhodomonas_salina.2